MAENPNLIPAIHGAIGKLKSIFAQIDQIITDLKAAVQAPIAELDQEENRCPKCRAILSPFDLSPPLDFEEWTETLFTCGECGYKGIMHHKVVFDGYTNERGGPV